ncbi:hypothetical protein CEXT_351431 [Caerostris extrusa]|uniref:Uncharacterized protein n=1 Tax=Caerostris extrusa TaxID=172846 RepID=A0AAV4RJX1_CAEEX|nr:hypothetical protein CEXT_351431 [Caerostris extrusa]
MPPPKWRIRLASRMLHPLTPTPVMDGRTLFAKYWKVGGEDEGILIDTGDGNICRASEIGLTYLAGSDICCSLVNILPPLLLLDWIIDWSATTKCTSTL